MIFYNEAAGALLGRPFEEIGQRSGDDWVQMFGPLDDDGNPIPIADNPMTHALRANLAAHMHQRIRTLAGVEHEIEVSGLPLIGTDGFHGAMIFFWVAEQG